MAQTQILRQTYAQYDSHHYHMYLVNDIYMVGSVFMPASLSATAIAAGWAQSTASAVTAAEIEPHLEVQSKQVGANQKLI